MLKDELVGTENIFPRLLIAMLRNGAVYLVIVTRHSLQNMVIHMLIETEIHELQCNDFSYEVPLIFMTKENKLKQQISHGKISATHRRSEWQMHNPKDELVSEDSQFITPLLDADHQQWWREYSDPLLKIVFQNGKIFHHNKSPHYAQYLSSVCYIMIYVTVSGLFLMY